MRTKQVVLGGLIFTLTLAMGCCAAVFVGAGAAGYGFVRGELKANLSADLNKAYNATLKAMEKLEFNVINKDKDALSAKITARNAQDKKVQIKLARTGEDITEIRIRIGVFGNQRQSIAIFDQIKEYL